VPTQIGLVLVRVVAMRRLSQSDVVLALLFGSVNEAAGFSPHALPSRGRLSQPAVPFH